MIMLWGGSTAAGVTVPLPCWCYELIVSFCDQVGSANVINAGYRSLQKRASPSCQSRVASILLEQRELPVSSGRDLEDSLEG